ncbi:nucleoside deaminase [Arvimicrobium flavum]|uniref:nucleoside deaminase n=1 Tax=Arvimicrobium flavum TaxID=3393320 RepID=UPI00237A7E16|nr:nucleoside deaminase [Mesorhizobium shangrilense]
MSDLDHAALLRRAIDLSQNAREKGNHPFGAILVDRNGTIILEAENTVTEDNDETSHAELNLISEACRRFSAEERRQTVMYASTEPCAMCAGATFWAGIRTVVYGLSEEGLYGITTQGRENPAVLKLSCREVFAAGGSHETAVTGPLLEEEARKPHIGFWSAYRRPS